MRTLDLTGDWELSPVKTFPASIDTIQEWMKMSVPSHWQQHPDLENYSGKVVYRKTFSFKKKKASVYRLALPGIFYYSTVFLNGRRLGDHEGYFAPQSYDVTDLLSAKNELVVYVDCPEEKSKNDKRMITGVFSHWDCLDPKTNPGGIWLSPEIHEGAGVLIEGVKIHTESIREGRAVMRMGLEAISRDAGKIHVKIAYSPTNFKGKAQTFEQDVEVAAGRNRFDLTQELAEPRLWWTHDLGNPDLYDVEITLAGEKGKKLDVYTETIGVRTIEVRDWIFYLNGVRLYIKGNNYAPGDTRIATVTREGAERDLKLAAECHMNLLRVHAHIDHPEFYRAADRAGVLLWQDFALQWSYKREVLPIAREQIKQMVRLLYNHPSIALWCCHNEAIYLVDTKDEDFANIAKSAFSIFGWSWNRDVMDVELVKAVRQEDTTRFVNRSSGEPALFKKGGDTHFYFGWYRVQGPKRAFDKVMKIAPKNLRFITEFGAQSFPNLASCEKFMNKDIRQIDWQKLQERHSLQIDLMEHWVGLKRESLAELIEASQEYQSRINQYYIDRIRWKKYAPGGGVVPFMFNDPNPAIQWSIVDYWRAPKKSYYAMQTALAPQYCFVLLAKDSYALGETISIPLYAINDARESFDKVHITLTLRGPEGLKLTERGFDLFLPQDCMAIPVASVPLVLEKPGTYTLTLNMTHPKFSLTNDYPVVVK